MQGVISQGGCREAGQHPEEGRLCKGDSKREHPSIHPNGTPVSIPGVPQYPLGPTGAMWLQGGVGGHQGEKGGGAAHG